MVTVNIGLATEASYSDTVVAAKNSIQIENSYTSTATSSTSVSISPTTFPSSGSTLLAVLTKNGTSATTGPSAGTWTLKQGIDSGTAIRTELWACDIGSPPLGLSGLTLDSTVSVTSGYTPKSIAFNNDGTVAVVAIWYSSKFILEQYNLTTAYDFTSATLDGSVNLYTEFGSNYSDCSGPIQFGKNGDSLFVYASTFQYKCREVKLSIAYDVLSTLSEGNTYAGPYYSSAFLFKTDGTRIFIMTQGGYLYQADLSTAWDLTTVGTLSSYYDIGASNSTEPEFSLSSDGKSIFCISRNDSNYTLGEKTLSTAWDLSTVSNDFVALKDLGSTPFDDNMNMSSITPLSNGKRWMYLFGFSIATNFYQYEYPDGFTWTGDNQNYVLYYAELSGVKYSKIHTVTANTGTNASPISPGDTTGNKLGHIVFAGFGVDGDSTPQSLDSDLTQEANQQTGATGVGQAVGYYIEPSASKAFSSFTHSLNSADDWVGWTIHIESDTDTSIAIGYATELNGILGINRITSDSLLIPKESDLSIPLHIDGTVHLFQSRSFDYGLPFKLGSYKLSVGHEYDVANTISIFKPYVKEVYTGLYGSVKNIEIDDILVLVHGAYSTKHWMIPGWTQRSTESYIRVYTRNYTAAELNEVEPTFNYDVVRTERTYSNFFDLIYGRNGSLTMSADGHYLYVASHGSVIKVQNFYLSTAWDISTALLYSESELIGLAASGYNTITLNPNNREVYITGQSSYVHSLTMTSAHDLTYLSVNHITSFFNFQAACFHHDGSTILCYGAAVSGNGSTWAHIDLTTPWDLTTAKVRNSDLTLTSNYDPNSIVHMFFGEDGYTLFCQRDPEYYNTIYELSLTNQYDISETVLSAQNELQAGIGGSLYDRSFYFFPSASNKHGFLASWFDQLGAKRFTEFKFIASTNEKKYAIASSGGSPDTYLFHIGAANVGSLVLNDSNGTSSTIPIAPSVTTTTTRDLVVSGFLTDNGGSAGGVDASLTEIVPDTVQYGSAFGYEYPVQGATGTYTHSHEIAVDYKSITFKVSPTSINHYDIFAATETDYANPFDMDLSSWLEVATEEDSIHYIHPMPPGGILTNYATEASSTFTLNHAFTRHFNYATEGDVGHDVQSSRALYLSAITTYESGSSFTVNWTKNHPFNYAIESSVGLRNFPTIFTTVNYGTETDDEFPITPIHVLSVNYAGEADTSFTWDDSKEKTISYATEDDTVTALIGYKATYLNQALSESVVTALAKAKEAVISFDSETSSNFDISFDKEWLIGITQETSASFVVDWDKVAYLQLTSASSEALKMGKTKDITFSFASTASNATGMTVIPAFRLHLDQAIESSNAFDKNKFKYAYIGFAAERDLAQSVPYFVLLFKRDFVYFDLWINPGEAHELMTFAGSFKTEAHIDQLKDIIANTAVDVQYDNSIGTNPTFDMVDIDEVETISLDLSVKRSNVVSFYLKINEKHDLLTDMTYPSDMNVRANEDIVCTVRRSYTEWIES